MPSVTYLQLDASYDPIFDPAYALADSQAVAQDVLTRLKLFLGEWWEDLNLGMPVFQSMLGQLASSKTQNAVRLIIQQTILATPYVVSVTGIQSSFSNGQFSFTATFTTTFGQVTVSSAPGDSASLGN
jgi:hypothetical protein